MQTKLNINGNEISIVSKGTEDDFISLTDIAKYKNSKEPYIVICNWLRSTSTIQFLGLWEKLHNPNFNPIDFDRFKNESGENAFTLSPQKWIKATNAIGIVSKPGRYGGGTLAHKDIAFEFASWISPEFKLYIIQDYQKLKSDVNGKLSLQWNLKRELAKLNYKIHTDAIKYNLIPPELNSKQASFTYADEADMINLALFGVTAKQWHLDNPKLKGNIRDYASIEQLIVLGNLENTNALLVKQQIPQKSRLKTLRQMTIEQLNLLTNDKAVKRIKKIGQESKNIEK